MMRRLVVVAVLLFMVAPAALAKRRAVSARPPSSCTVGTLVPATYANVLASDGEYVYLVDESSMLLRVPRLGGEVQPLAEVPEGQLPLAMLVDATHVYISALPFEVIFTPVPGSIIAIPKGGGVAEVLASGVETAFTLAMDDTHLYWAAAGILDFAEEGLRPGGKIERMKKDGSERTTLASDLSAPLGLALSGNDLYFGETGFATGDASVGLYRVSKDGGPVVTLLPDMVTASVAVAGDSIVIVGADDEMTVGLYEIDRLNPGSVRTLLADESLLYNMKLADGRAYVIAEREATELLAVDLDTPGFARVVRTDLDGDAFELVDCAAVVNTIDGDVVRAAR